MGVNYNGYNYLTSNAGFIQTENGGPSRRPGTALFSGDVQPIAAQNGDLWISGSGIKRWDGSAWQVYGSSGSGTGSTALKAGTVTWTGSQTTVNFSGALSVSPSVVVTPSTGYADVEFSVISTSTSGFIVQAFNQETGAPTSGTYTVNWMAVSQGTTGSITAGVVTGVTNSSGLLVQSGGSSSISYGTSYSSTPSITASFTGSLGTWSSGSGNYEPTIAIKNASSSSFGIYVFNADSGNPISGYSYTVSWIATPYN